MSVITPGRNIVLIGLMGSGKSTVGELLAQRLDRPFADTDAMVERAVGASIAQIFEQSGEKAFRRLESEAVRRVAALRGQVVAVGGGAVLDRSNVTHLRSTGDLVQLDADPRTLAERVADPSSRPLLAGDEEPADRLAALQSARSAAYADAAAHSIDTTDQSPEQIAAAVLEWARTRPGLLSRDELP